VPTTAESKPRDADSTPPDSARLPEPDPIDDLKNHAAEFWAYLRHLAAAKWHGKVHSLRRLALAAALGAVVIGAGAVALATAVVLAIVGLSNGLTLLLGGRAWLAQLIVGLGVLALIALGLLIVRSAVLAKWRRATAAKFEARGHEQRIRFQRDVSDAAGAYLRERIPLGAGGAGGAGPEANGRGD